MTRSNLPTPDHKPFDYNLVLIGFMGAGKSTVSDYFHTVFGMEVIEMDRIIAEREGMSISEIFKTRGEEYFRDCETALLITGGRSAEMKKNGRVILLCVEPETVLARLKDDHSRPLLENNKNVGFVSGLMEKRRAKYEAAADIIIHTDHKSVQEICDEILMQLQAMDAAGV